MLCHVPFCDSLFQQRKNVFERQRTNEGFGLWALIKPPMWVGGSVCVGGGTRVFWVLEQTTVTSKCEAGLSRYGGQQTISPTDSTSAVASLISWYSLCWVLNQFCCAVHCYTFLNIPFYLQSVQAPSANCVMKKYDHIRQKTHMAQTHLYETETTSHHPTNAYWLLSHKSKLSTSNKILIYKAILMPIWTYWIQLWGAASTSNIEILERFQSHSN
jgi:hypothetical protein